MLPRNGSAMVSSRGTPAHQSFIPGHPRGPPNATAPLCLTEDDLVTHPLVVGPQGHREQVQRPHFFVLERISPLRCPGSRWPAEDERERLPAYRIPPPAARGKGGRLDQLRLQD